MKKFGLQTVIILIVGFIVHQFLPFWGTAVIAAVVGLLFRYENSAASFAAGFAAGSLLWGTYAGLLNSGNLSFLSNMLGELFKTNGAYLVYATGLIGGLLGGMGAITGTLARKMFEKDSPSVA
ncbi:MAG: hypothetical protein H6577_13705 [Lewinellaceae bacterium]|nr:hypothetical protein [Saprospiraceae bacterium]MCB9339181.1 hypothetical protein [Lewinellaceae bacterium]